MWTKLEEIFEKIGLNYSRQGSYSDASEYPPSFFTFWNFETPEEGHYDNDAHRAIWNWQIYYYTNNPATLYSTMDEFIRLAKEAGFIIEGRGTDIPSDRPDYPGRMITIKYIEEYYSTQEA